MKAVILVGGLGTRLRPLTFNTPKAMMPVLNVPFLEYVIRRLSSHNVRDIVLAISHLAQPIENYFGDGCKLGVSLSYTTEETALGTAGAVKNAGKYLDNEACLVLNGDIFTDLDLTDMISFHRRSQSVATIALTPVENPTLYGLVETDDHGRITRFLEKPAWEDVTTNMINAGTYILEPEVLAAIPPQTNFSFEHQVFPPLLEQGKPIYAFPSLCYWMDIGTPEKYRQLNLDLLNGKSNQCQPTDTGISIGENSEIHPTAEITGPAMIGDSCSIGKNTRLNGPLVIGSGSVIADDTIADDSIIWHDVVIETGATISNSIIANGCRLGANSTVENSVVPDNVTIAEEYRMINCDDIQPGDAIG